jgi:hypothetical protein
MWSINSMFLKNIFSVHHEYQIKGLFAHSSNVFIHVCVCARATFLKSFAALSASGLRTPLEWTGEYSATARRAAVKHVRGGANLNFTFQLIFHTLAPRIGS